LPFWRELGEEGVRVEEGKEERREGFFTELKEFRVRIFKKKRWVKF
jgi:hypothetical protein